MTNSNRQSDPPTTPTTQIMAEIARERMHRLLRLIDRVITSDRLWSPRTTDRHIQVIVLQSFQQTD